ncbi:hypothetical protein [Halosimplex sp. J119]
MSEDYVPVYDEDGNLKHYQSTELTFEKVEATGEFTDPSGKTHTGGIAGGGGMTLLARYTSISTHSGSYNGLIFVEAGNLTLSSSEPDDGNFLVIANYGADLCTIDDNSNASFRHEGSTMPPNSVAINTGQMVWVVWNESEGWWEVSGDCLISG